MPGKNGIDLLREFDPITFEVIFITAYSDYLLQAFHFSAVDYLLKPIDEELLVQAVKRAGQRIELKSGNRTIETLLHNLQLPRQPLRMKLCIPSIKGFQVVELSDILYCEANSSYTNFHFVNRHLICASKPLHEYESLLADSHFIRIHKSYLVNIEYIREYVRGDGGSVILTNGQEIEVSRSKKEVLIARMKEHYKF